MWWLLLGPITHAADADEDARSLAEARLAAEPASADRWTALAATVDDPRAAEPLLREALRLDPDHVDALIGLARLLGGLGDPAAAEVLARAEQLAPEDRRVRLAAAETRSDPDLARAVWAAFPGDPDAALLVARLAPEEATAALRSVATPDLRVWVARITADLRQGDRADAELALASLGAAFPTAADLPRLARWTGCLRAGTVTPDALSALLDLRRRAMVDPTASDGPPDDRFAVAAACPAALALRATLRADRGDPEGAVRDLETAAALAPGDAALAQDLGEALLAVDRPADARPWLASAAAGRPWVPPLALARALHRTGDDDAARTLLADPRFADRASVVFARAELAETREEALALLVDAGRRTGHPRILQRARALADTLGQDVALAVPQTPLPQLAEGVEELVVTARKPSEVRLEALVGRLREMGYGVPVVRANGDVYFAAVDVQHPWVALHPDGQFDVQRSGYVPIGNPFHLQEVLGENLVQVTVPVVSERKLKQQRARVMDEIIGDVRTWREALCAEGFEERLLVEIPETLDRVWRDGVALGGGGTLETPAERRQALLDHWATRTCTPEGDQVRTLIVRYLEHEVQPSEWPVTEGELVATNARRVCPTTLALAGLGP